MYAVIATGGKQYRVTKDGVLRIEKLDAEPGATVEFGEVLLVGEGADVKVGIIAARDPDYDPARWWRYSEGVRDVMGEVIAYLYIRLCFYPATPV